MICNNKGADQPAHPYSLVSNFVICFLEVISRHDFLASLSSRGDWFETRFVGTPEDRFSRVVASYISVACLTVLGQILQVQQIIILKNNKEAIHQIC